MTFYLKYRPQTIAELDLDSVRQQLTQALSSKSLPHAFLFAGPRGLGKTSAARILAKAVNCESKPPARESSSKSSKLKAESSIEPCNQCDACVSITRGRALDVMEIDGASNRGIDDIRQLKEKIHLSPVTLTKKVYVIDEVHMLTKEAFNALLKTLEEPPEHAIFILATTEPEKLPPTIVSRCFVLTFSQPSAMEIKRSLERVIKGEKLKVDGEVLDLIAQQADGSFRDAHKILEQLAFAGNKIDTQLFASAFAAHGEDTLLQLLKKRDVAGGLAWVQQAGGRGADWRVVLQKLLEKLRIELLAIYGVGQTKGFGFSESQLKRLVRLCTQAAGDLKRAPLPHLPLEMVIIEFCCEDNSGNQNDPAKSAPPPEPTKNRADREPEKPPEPLALAPSEITNRWEEVLQVVKPQNHSVEALLRSARPLGIEGKAVVVEVFYEFHKGRLETAKCRSIVEQSLRQVLRNEQVQVRYTLGQRRNQKPSETESQDDELVKNAEAIFSVS